MLNNKAQNYTSVNYNSVYKKATLNLTGQHWWGSFLQFTTSALFFQFFTAKICIKSQKQSISQAMLCYNCATHGFVDSQKAVQPSKVCQKSEDTYSTLRLPKTPWVYMLLRKSSPRSVQLLMMPHQLLISRFTYLNMNLQQKLCNSFKICVDFMLSEIRTQNLLIYLHIFSRLHEAIPTHSPGWGS